MPYGRPIRTPSRPLVPLDDPAPPAPKAPILNAHTLYAGVVKKLQFGRGFGFILADDGWECFFHFSALSHPEGVDSHQVFEGLKERETRVTFHAAGAEKGPRALQVWVVDGE